MVRPGRLRPGDRHVVKKKPTQLIVTPNCGGAPWGGTYTGGGSLPTMRRRANADPARLERDAGPGPMSVAWVFAVTPGMSVSSGRKELSEVM